MTYEAQGGLERWTHFSVSCYLCEVLDHNMELYRKVTDFNMILKMWNIATGSCFKKVSLNQLPESGLINHYYKS